MSDPHGQRHAALERANMVRIARANLKRRLAAGEIDIRALLASPPECVASMAVFELLCTVPRVGPVKAKRVLKAACVSPTRPFGDLTVREREKLAWWLQARSRSAA